MTDLLVVEDLRVEYLSDDGDVCVVDDVSFRIAEGQIYGLAGESGSGKSTIVKSLLRILKAPGAITGGRVLFRGRDILDMNEEQLRRFRWKSVSLVMQSAMNALNPVMTIGAQIADIFEVHEGLSYRLALDRAADLLDLVAIDRDRLRSYPHELSGGMRQRVVIAAALALRPDLILMDEPTTALDVVVEKKILEQIVELQARLGFAVLFISHDLSLMLELCSTIGVLYAGRLAEEGPAAELFHDPKHPYTEGLMRSFPDARQKSENLAGIGGTPPSMAAPPSGCRFHPRCEHAVERCREQRPALIELDHKRRTACFLHE
jgi:peptide/nickel transport system ATP-binding protein